MLLSFVWVSPAEASTYREVQARLDAAMAAGQPVVVHVVVALCDNVNQGIAPVQAALGNGQDPSRNLYWGALYGVRRFLTRKAGWSKFETPRPTDRRILERVALHAELERGDRSVPVYIVADAWDGARIRAATQNYLRMVAGHDPETVTVKRSSDTLELKAGGSARLFAYIGHNGLMEFSVDGVSALGGAKPRSAIVLACASKPYFADHLRAAGAHPLVLTTNLMAPEAYTLDAAIRAWVANAPSKRVVDAAARAYQRYQKCGLTAARRLFWGEP